MAPIYFIITKCLFALCSLPFALCFSFHSVVIQGLPYTRNPKISTQLQSILAFQFDITRKNFSASRIEELAIPTTIGGLLQII